MVVINRICTTCSNEFELHFRYQMEEHAERGDNGVVQTRHAFYCSQRCLEASHRGRTDGAVPCDACATRFEVELASQVLFTGGRRHYACSPDCRTRILSGVRSVRLGQLLDPAYPLEHDEQAAVSPAAPAVAHTATVSELRPAHKEPEIAASVRPANGPRVLAVFNHQGGTRKTTTA